MQNLTRLFKILQLTRSQPQYGYSLVGIKKGQQSDLAQHQYLVALFAWQLALAANQKGAKLNLEKVLTLALVHDLGELLGGDISMPYAKINIEAKKAAKQFEAINQNFIASFFGHQENSLNNLFKEVLNYQTDEGFVVKIADNIECAHFRLYMNAIEPADLQQHTAGLLEIVNKFSNIKTKQFFRQFIKFWSKNFFKNNGRNGLEWIIGKK